MLTVYTDGSCVYPEPGTGTGLPAEGGPDDLEVDDLAAHDAAPSTLGTGGWAWWICHTVHASGTRPHATSLQMEAHAATQALRALPVATPVTLMIDNHEVVTVMQRAATTDYTSWPWLPRSQTPYTDLDYWDDLADAVAARTAPTVWAKIKGHAGNPGNVRADRLARTAAQHAAGTYRPTPWRLGIPTRNPRPPLRRLDTRTRVA